MKTVLVTGGAGYIGSHTCKALAMAGFQPIAYDNLVNGHRWAVRWGPFEHGDILDRTRLDEVIAKYRPSAVIHFAAYAYVGESVADPGKYYRNNVAGSLTLIEALRDHDIHIMVFSSSCAVYGTPKQLPIAENAPKCPISPYGRSKLIIEEMLRDFERSHGLRWMALRYFNAAGADPDGELGEQHQPETHIIPLALDAALGRRKAFTIFGVDYDTPDGTCIRDYIHVSDLADGHVKALRALGGGRSSNQFNLGVGKGFSVREVIEAVQRATGMKVPCEIGVRRKGDPAILVSNPTIARETLGWKPAFQELDDIVRTAWHWHRFGPREDPINTNPHNE